MLTIISNLLSLLAAQIQHFCMQCHLFLLLGLELFLDYAFHEYLVIFGVKITKFIAAILMLFIYTILIIMIISIFRNLLSRVVYYLLIHAYGKAYTGVMWFVSLPKLVVICAVSLLLYTTLCFFLSYILIDYSFSQSFIKPVEEVELRILEQFHWFSVELAEHKHFRETFLVSGLCELNQQIIDYLIQQAEVHNTVCHANSKESYLRLSQLRAQVVCDLIHRETGDTVTLDYTQATEYRLANKKSGSKSSLFSKFTSFFNIN